MSISFNWILNLENYWKGYLPNNLYTVFWSRDDKLCIFMSHNWNFFEYWLNNFKIKIDSLWAKFSRLENDPAARAKFVKYVVEIWSRDDKICIFYVVSYVLKYW